MHLSQDTPYQEERRSHLDGQSTWPSLEIGCRSKFPTRFVQNLYIKWDKEERQFIKEFTGVEQIQGCASCQGFTLLHEQLERFWPWDWVQP
jgi:hypothetical protein